MEESQVFYVTHEPEAGSEKDRPFYYLWGKGILAIVRTLAQKLRFSTIRLAATLPLSGVKGKVDRETKKGSYPLSSCTTPHPHLQSEVKFLSSMDTCGQNWKVPPPKENYTFWGDHVEKTVPRAMPAESFRAREMYLKCVKMDIIW